MSPTAFNRLERGLQSVSAECLARLAKILGVSSDSLLGMNTQEVLAEPDMHTKSEDEVPERVPTVAVLASETVCHGGEAFLG